MAPTLTPPPNHEPAPPSRRRRPYRVPVGMPGARQDWRKSAVFSALVHAAIIALIISPFGIAANIIAIEQGAGGPGPAGGGGGGRRGTGQRQEALKFVTVAPAPTPAPVKPAVTLPPPLPPVIPPTPTPQPQLEQLKMPEAPVMPIGTGGGTGTDQTNGTGPGSGGGVGTGIGTGRGSGVGPGTGGGTQENYPPTADIIFIPPMPVPASARGFRVIAEFDVDETGRVLAMDFTRTKDRGYNRRLEEALKGYRFKPGHRPDGTPIRMKAQIIVDLP